MAKIIKFRLNYSPSKRQVLQWLSKNYDLFPSVEIATDRIFHNWRFVRGVDNIVYFANCIDRGITENDLIEFKRDNRIIS